MNFRLATPIAVVLALINVGIATADVFDKLSRSVRLQFLQSLVIGNGRPASARIDGVKKSLIKAEWQQFKAQLGWSALSADHEGYACVNGDCQAAKSYICNPEFCHGKCVTLSGLLESVPPRTRKDFLMGLRFDNGRAVNLPLAKVRPHLKRAEIAALEAMGRQ